MKKKLHVLLSVVAASVFLAACNTTPEQTNTDITPTVAVEKPTETNPAETPDATETPAPTETPTAEPLPTATPAPTATPRPDL